MRRSGHLSEVAPASVRIRLRRPWRIIRRELVEHEYLGIDSHFGCDAPSSEPDRITACCWRVARAADARRPSHASGGLIMLDPSRKHGHYDQRWPARFFHTTSASTNGARVNRVADSVNGAELSKQARHEEVGRGAIDAWEAEGGYADSEPRHENGRVHRLERKSLAAGLSWVMFSETFYPGRSEHSFPAITAWSRYRDGDRSWPQGARQRAPSARERSS